MSNNRHKVSNFKLENVNQQNVKCATDCQWNSYQGPIMTPLQVFITQEFQNSFKTNQNHRMCTCPPEVHRALLEQKLGQQQNVHHHLQPCPHQRQYMRIAGPNSVLESQSMYTLVNQQQVYLQHQNKVESIVPFPLDHTSIKTIHPGTSQSTMRLGSEDVNRALCHSHQDCYPETLVEARAHISQMESRLTHLTSWIQCHLRINDSNPMNNNYVLSAPNLLITNQESPSLSQDHNYPLFSMVTSDSTTTDFKESHSNVEITPSNSSLDSAFSAKSATSSDNNPYAQKQQLIMNTTTKNELPSLLEDKLPTDLITKLEEIKSHLRSMKEDLNTLRKLNQSFRYSFKDEINENFLKITKLIKSTPGLNNIPVQNERQNVDEKIVIYSLNVETRMDQLANCEMAIEDLRVHVLTRRCRVNVQEVEMLALHLSRISKDLAAGKADFSILGMSLKNIMKIGEELRRSNERFMAEEHKRIDNALRLCKKLISTLFTLKRLGSVQNNSGRDVIPEIRSNRDPRSKDKQAIFEGIKTISPDHDHRMQQLELAEKLRECRKRMLASHESLKFEKSLELTTKSLKDVRSSPSSKTDNLHSEVDKIFQFNVTSNKLGMSGSLSSLTDSDADFEVNYSSETSVIPNDECKFETEHIYPHKILSNTSYTSSHDTSNDQDSSNSVSSIRPKPSITEGVTSYLLSSKYGTILKTSQYSTRSNRSSKVAFNKSVTVEGCSDILQLNCPEDDYTDDLSSMKSSSSLPIPRLSSQDDSVNSSETISIDSSSTGENIWYH